VIEMFPRSVKADVSEAARSLPGDELIPEAIGSFTQAITIRRPPADVWPWLAQMGAGSRAGWYSYDFLDNSGHRSAERIVPELQSVAIGMLFPALPGRTDGFHLLQWEPGRHLVLGWLDGKECAPMTTWSFLLEETKNGFTRLIVRVRGGQNYNLRRPWWAEKRVLRLVHFIMQRKQLLGIARRAEERINKAA
jgi:hypothetical protein